jgi:acyl carrier protein
MTAAGLRAAVRALLAEHIDVPDDDDTSLGLDSFALVVVAEELEPRFGVRVAARDVTAAHFGTVARLVAYVTGKTPA